MKISIAKARANGQISEDQNYGYISVFEINLFKQLQTHIFNSADIDWLHCVAAHRKKKLFIEVESEMGKYNIITGKIADDATNPLMLQPAIEKDLNDGQNSII